MRELDTETLAKYAYLWDGSDPGWVVCGHYQDQAAVRILLPEQGIDSHFLKILRSLFLLDSQWRDASTAASWKAAMFTRFDGNAQRPESSWHLKIAAWSSIDSSMNGATQHFSSRTKRLPSRSGKRPSVEACLHVTRQTESFSDTDLPSLLGLVGGPSGPSFSHGQ
jgi:hypothetical protein